MVRIGLSVTESLFRGADRGSAIGAAAAGTIKTVSALSGDPTWREAAALQPGFRRDLDGES